MSPLGWKARSGSYEYATASRSPGARSASSRQNAIACSGSSQVEKAVGDLPCLRREKRSSSAAATVSPSISSAAAGSWKTALIPRTAAMCPRLLPRSASLLTPEVRSSTPLRGQSLNRLSRDDRLAVSPVTQGAGRGVTGMPRRARQACGPAWTRTQNHLPPRRGARALRALRPRPRAGRPRGADRALHAARAASRAPLPRRDRARRHRAGRLAGAREGGRPLRPRAGHRVRLVRDADDPRRDQALLPRLRLAGARPTRVAGARGQGRARFRGADEHARPRADAGRARGGDRHDRRARARGTGERHGAPPAGAGPSPPGGRGRTAARARGDRGARLRRGRGRGRGGLAAGAAARARPADHRVALPRRHAAARDRHVARHLADAGLARARSLDRDAARARRGALVGELALALGDLAVSPRHGAQPLGLLTRAVRVLDVLGDLVRDVRMHLVSGGRVLVGLCCPLCRFRRTPAGLADALARIVIGHAATDSPTAPPEPGPRRSSDRERAYSSAEGWPSIRTIAPWTRSPSVAFGFTRGSTVALMTIGRPRRLTASSRRPSRSWLPASTARSGTASCSNGSPMSRLRKWWSTASSGRSPHSSWAPWFHTCTRCSLSSTATPSSSDVRIASRKSLTWLSSPVRSRSSSLIVSSSSLVDWSSSFIVSSSSLVDCSSSLVVWSSSLADCSSSLVVSSSSIVDCSSS